MKFIDEASITVQSGNGGAGSRHFRREKFVPFGGPDGGNGGSGGDVTAEADSRLSTLLDFRYRKHWAAQNGEPGAGNRKSGRDGNDVIIRVPVGTEIRSSLTGELVADLDSDGKKVVLAKGGLGGKGNTFFKSATNQAPDYAQPGQNGEHASFDLELKLMADVGLVGFPNAGKSTLISTISSARPKIADYPFTTLAPNLGVVAVGPERSFVVADVPGLISGASEGRGLGSEFLRHLSRTSILVHLIDPFQLGEEGEPLEPLESYRIIRNELEHYDPELADKEAFVLLTKADTYDSEQAAAFLEPLKKAGLNALLISSASQTGTRELINQISRVLEARKESVEPVDQSKVA